MENLEKALKTLLLVFLEGRASTSQNPYTRPEVKEALDLLYGKWTDAPGPKELRKELGLPEEEV
jgi:hypothetical protein